MKSLERLHWYLIRTRRVFEVKHTLDTLPCVVETYVPLRLKEEAATKGNAAQTTPAVSRLLFVRAYYEPLRSYLVDNRLPAWVELGADRRPDNPAVIDDDEMERFKVFNESGLPLMFLRDPYHSFSKFDRVRILTGPFAGYEGFLRDIRHDTKLITHLGAWTMAISKIHIYDVQVVARGDKLSEAAHLARLRDYFTNKAYAVGVIDHAPALLRAIVQGVGATGNVATYRKRLLPQGPVAASSILDFIQQLTASDEMSLVQMCRYIYGKEPQPVLEQLFPDSPLRPFLTISPGTAIANGQAYGTIEHKNLDSNGMAVADEQPCGTAFPCGFTERVVPVVIDEGRYNADSDTTENVSGRYYAHVAMRQTTDGLQLFANFAAFHKFYAPLDPDDRQRLADRTAKEHAPLLHSLLTATHPSQLHIAAISGTNVAGLTQIISPSNACQTQTPTFSATDIDAAIACFIDAAVALCKEIASQSRLKTWRNMLDTVWIRQ